MAREASVFFKSIILLLETNLNSQGLNFFLAPPHWLRSLTDRWLIWHFPAGEKKIFLSFDDGPTPGLTEKVLEILEHYNAKATFFLVGKKAEAHPDLVHALLAKNHAIGSHGWEHIDGWRTKTKAFVKNAERFPADISISLFRPPYGRIFPWQAKTLQSKGLKIIMWSLLSRDYAALPDLDAALEKIIKLTADGSIVVFHDSAKAKNNCLYLLPRFLDHFKKQGFSFVAMTMTQKP